MNDILEIEGLSVQFNTEEGAVKALTNISFSIRQKETFGLVGETGCGKTMTAFSILKLIPPPGNITNGSIRFNSGNGKVIDIASAKEKEIRRIRGNCISMVFQEPGSSLNPVFTIGEQIAEVLQVHGRKELGQAALSSVEIDLAKTESQDRAFRPFRKIQASLFKSIVADPNSRVPRLIEKIPLIRRLMWRMSAQATLKAINMLKEVDIPDPERVIKAFPHQLSGGMKQRAVIAMALAHSPRLLLADEPTTALDVTIQSQIIALLNKLKNEFDASILYITHDLGVASEICDRIGVMYAGSLVELAPVMEIFSNPVHPYTRALLAAIPKPGCEPKPIEGTVPDPINPPTGCRFHPRCPIASEACRSGEPPVITVNTEHTVRCFNAGDHIEQHS